jgi:hypothetical protein
VYLSLGGSPCPLHSSGDQLMSMWGGSLGEEEVKATGRVRAKGGKHGQIDAEGPVSPAGA